MRWLTASSSFPTLSLNRFTDPPAALGESVSSRSFSGPRKQPNCVKSAVQMR
jgi:hypothetical protein